MPSKKLKDPIEPGFVYHIYNRGNNYQDVFLNDSDYVLFLSKLKEYLSGWCSFYAFALLKNHYHLLIRANENINTGDFSKQYARFILSYTNKINYIYSRNGSLFMSYFRRIRVTNDDYLKRLIFYIHHNPEKHNLVNDFKSYQWSSYKSIISNRITAIERNDVLDFYGGKNEFVDYHNYRHEEHIIKQLLMEE